MTNKKSILPIIHHSLYIILISIFMSIYPQYNHIHVPHSGLVMCVCACACGVWIWCDMAGFIHSPHTVTHTDGSVFSRHWPPLTPLTVQHHCVCVCSLGIMSICLWIQDNVVVATVRFHDMTENVLKCSEKSAIWLYDEFECMIFSSAILMLYSGIRSSNNLFW